MRATPIPNDEVPEGTRRVVVGPPLADNVTESEISPIEMLHCLDDDGRNTLSARFILEPGDLEELEAGDTIWVTFWGRIAPFNVVVGHPAM